jgi:hypothetical protein
MLATARDPVALVEREARLAVEQQGGVADQRTIGPREGPAPRLHQAQAAAGNGALVPQSYGDELFVGDVPLRVSPRKTERSVRLQGETRA